LGYMKTDDALPAARLLPSHCGPGCEP
jgi:hypothetical protein